MAGTPHPIRRELTADLLGFDGLIENAMDAVSTRDHLQEVASVCAILASNLSRMAAELILWSSPEFKRVRLSDSWSTGSSIMPQKRNPDTEWSRGQKPPLVRFTLVGAHRGLPMANRDLRRITGTPTHPDRFRLVGVLFGCVESMRILPGPDLERSALVRNRRLPCR